MHQPVGPAHAVDAADGVDQPLGKRCRSWRPLAVVEGPAPAGPPGRCGDGLLEDPVEGVVQRVGQHVGAADERDAEHDGERRQREADATRQDASDRRLPHAPRRLLCAPTMMLGGARGLTGIGAGVESARTTAGPPRDRQEIDMGLLDGQRAVITGGGSGIGRATCRRMAAGASVAVLDLDGDAAEYSGTKDIDGVAYAVDVTDYDALEAAITGAADALGRICPLFNNAGNSNDGADPRLGSRRVGPDRAPQPHRRVPQDSVGMHPHARRRRRQHREHRVDQRHPPVGRRGPLRGGQGRGRRAHRDCRARVRADHPGELGFPRDDPHRVDRHPPHRLRLDRPAHGGQDAAGPHRHAPRTSPTSSCSCAPTWPAS